MDIKEPEDKPKDEPEEMELEAKVFKESPEGDLVLVDPEEKPEDEEKTEEEKEEEVKPEEKEGAGPSEEPEDKKVIFSKPIDLQFVHALTTFCTGSVLGNIFYDLL